MPANNKQIGGTHYSVLPYQHWDWVADAGLTYLQGQATKYLARYPRTRRLEDLRKALHYCEKMEELNRTRRASTRKFLNQFDNVLLRHALADISTDVPESAHNQIQELILRHPAAPVPLTEETHHGERLAQERSQGESADA